TSAPLMTSTLPRRPVNLLRSRGEGHPQHLRSGAEVPSNPTAAWWLVNPGDPGRTKGATMLSRVKKVALGVAAVSGAAVGGAAVAGAATSHSGTTATPATTAGQPPAVPKNMPTPGTAAHEDAEKAVTGDAAAKA